jgi:hypothetical protein
MTHHTLLALMLALPMASFADLTAYKIQCADIGFKKGTEKFGDCVMELKKRDAGRSSANKQSQPTKATAQRGDDTLDDRNCQKFGFTPGTTDYSQCRMELELAAAKAQREFAVYEEQKRIYDQQVAAKEAEKKNRHNRGLIAAGLCIMAGTECPHYPRRADGSPLGYPPSSPFEKYQLTLPGGRDADCRYNSLTKHMDCDY